MTKTKQDKPVNNLSEKLTWLPKKTFELEFSLPWQKVKQTYDQVLQEEASKTTLPGFRKGKAPVKLVEKKLDQQQVYQKILSRLLPDTYEKLVKQHQLKPIISPKIKLLSAKENEPWQFKATACERPEVKLGDYQKFVKGELSKGKIWTPGSGQPKTKNDSQASYDQKLKTVTKALLENVQVQVADLLLEDERDRMLTRLLDQINNLGLSIDQYLGSKGLTRDQLRSNFMKEAEQTLKLEFILQEIVKTRQVKIEPQEIEKFIQATPDKKVQAQLNTPMEKAYLASILAKRKVLDYLIAL